MRKHDLVVAAVALALCAFAFGLTFRFTTTTPAAMMSGMGAEFFPRIVIAAMALLAICIGLGIGNPPSEDPARIPGIVWITVGLLAVFVVALEILGMWVAAFVIMVGLGRLWGEKRLGRLAISSALMLGVIWFVFVRLLKGGFPEGILARLWS